jgi:hypothetical protein
MTNVPVIAITLMFDTVLLASRSFEAVSVISACVMFDTALMYINCFHY